MINMISISDYNAAEEAAIQVAPTLRKANDWGYVPERHPEFNWIKELGDLQFVLNRFQCDRYRSYMYELGGLSPSDVHKFATAGRTLVDMQRRFYPHLPPIVPIETMLSAFAIYRRIWDARPNARTILEIGPGAGFNSLFFAQNSLITNYTQIEATQATYLSQAMVNAMCFGNAVWEAAYPQMQTPRRTDRVWHIPWWRLDDLDSVATPYDVITANACLNEISDEIVDRYIKLFAAKSHDDTLLLIQCVGDWMFRNDVELMARLMAGGWTLVAETSGMDIEIVIGDTTRGGAVSTWWLTRSPGKPVTKLIPRLVDRSVILLGDDASTFMQADGRVWTRDDLMGLML